MEVAFQADLCRKLKVARPPPRLPIAERNYNQVLGTKAHLVLEADPEAVEREDPQWRTSGELRCPNCGNAHKNGELILCYRNCHHCLYVLRHPDDIEIREDQTAGLHVLAATYGHPVDASSAVDVTATLERLVERTKQLRILTTDNLGKLFGVDPCPRRRKALRLRYAINGRRGEVVAFESDRPFHLSRNVQLLASRSMMPLLSIEKATYGHPRGSIKGRGSFDVRDALQYRVDSTHGKSCVISAFEDLTKLFGEPCAGRAKHLVVEYEIAGKAGELYEYEIGGKLAKDINLDAAPSMAPQIIIDAATYGWTEASLAERRKAVQKQMFDVQTLQVRRSMGLPLSADDSKRLRQLPEIERSLELLDGVRLCHNDVADILQRRVEDAGGGHILYLGGRADDDVPDWARAALEPREPDDLNAIFGNPLPGEPKLLKIEYTIVGHDADRRADAPENVSSGGFESNFIKQRKGSFAAVVEDDARGRGTIDASLVLGTPTTLPPIEICYASYGHAADPTQAWDVTAEIKVVVNAFGGRRIYISAQDSLADLFGGDPCLGTRKKLTIRYHVRGFRGCCRIDEKPLNHLRTHLAIGFVQDNADPFSPVPRRPYRDESIERNMRLRMPPRRDSPTTSSPYAHLGAAY
ncbi:hypothetical protein CTAYLR_005246 [Chrysophaeum taylorii]|uniref:DnaJ-like protein C11 C-terminal domain-containing protein n=1 Tax=Chrysophaeum taylorii TaxID=2483200 RepID=A0AAD7UC58_9STRA|nr:hypothetical protein CTAYLR_005246 [Chrysophaeum taylorii]